MAKISEYDNYTGLGAVAGILEPSEDATEFNTVNRDRL